MINIELLYVFFQLIISLIPALTLLVWLDFSVIEEPYSFRTDHRTTISDALGESNRLKLIVTSMFLFFQALVVWVFARDAFTIIFVFAIIFVNLSAVYCWLTDYSSADFLTALLRKERETSLEDSVEKDVDKFISEKRGERVARSDIPLSHKGKQPRGGLLIKYCAIFVLAVFPVFSVSWAFLQFPGVAEQYVIASGYQTFGVETFNSVLTFALSNYGIGIECSETIKCSSEVENFLQVTSGTFYRSALFVYFLSISYPIIRFAFSLKEYRSLLNEGTTSDLGLETDVVQTLGLIGSILFSLLIASLLIGVPISELGLFSGLVAVGISLALRDTLGNLMAGALLIWDGSLKKGDVITIPQTDTNDTGSTYGIIEKMRMRYTVVQDRNTVRRLIPNSLLVAEPIESWTHEGNRVRLSLNIGVGYGTDLPKAKQIMESVCYDVSRIVTSKPPQALVVNFGDSSIDFSLRFWLRDTNAGIRPVISEVLMGIKQRFDDEGIEIPFPQQEITVKNSEIKAIADTGVKRIQQLLSR